MRSSRGPKEASSTQRPGNGSARPDEGSDEKWCPRCDEVKPLDAFAVAKRGRKGRYAYCWPCKREYERADQRRRREADPDGARRRERERTLRRKGITPERYDELLAEQGGGCAICAAAEPSWRPHHNLFVDHDHETGAVRGVLCDRCNHGIGYFRDDPELLQRAADYLR